MESFDDIKMSYITLRSDRKTLAIEVKVNGEVIVRAPKRITERQIDAFVTEHRDWIIKKQTEVAARATSPYRRPLTKKEIAALYEKARGDLPTRVAVWATRMGVTPRRISVTAAQKRFGSCSSANRLCFSYHLMRYPDEVIDYVVVHELAHILHHNHSREFYACIAHYLPDYKEREKILKM